MTNYNKEKKVKPIEEYLNENEEILWKGTPNKKLSITKLIFSNIFPIVFLIFVHVLLTQSTIESFKSQSIEYIISSVVFQLIFLIPFFLLIPEIIKKSAKISTTLYIFTNERVMTRSYDEKITIKSIKYKNIKSINISNTPSDKIFKVGSIMIEGKSNHILIESIKDPILVMEQLQSYDSKYSVIDNKNNDDEDNEDDEEEIEVVDNKESNDIDSKSTNNRKSMADKIEENFRKVNNNDKK